MLVGRGELDYDEPVATWWPEFAVHGKAQVTLGDILSHQSGLTGLDEPLRLEEIADTDLLATRLADQAPLWEPRTAHCYHAVTFAFYVGVLVRRVGGRSVGRFIADEFSEPSDAPNHLLRRVCPEPGGAGVGDDVGVVTSEWPERSRAVAPTSSPWPSSRGC